MDDPLKNIEASSTNFSKIKRLNEKKYNDHHSAMQQYEGEYLSFIDTVESQILDCCNKLRDDLEKTDKNLASNMLDLNDNNYIIGYELDDVQHLIKELLSILQRRKEIIAKSMDDLNMVESNRQAVISKRINELIEKLCKIALVVHEEVDRIADEKAQEANLTILQNLK